LGILALLALSAPFRICKLQELLVDLEGGGRRSQLSTVAMDTASVLKEHGHKNGHNRHFCVFLDRSSLF